MKTFTPGLVHIPVTPFKSDQSVDYDTYAKVLEFHIANGAELFNAFEKYDIHVSAPYFTMYGRRPM